MANSSKDKSSPASAGVTASGIVEAVTQDVELSMEQFRVAAHGAVAAVEETLGIRKSAKKPKAKIVKPKAKPSNQPKAKTSKMMKSNASKGGKKPKGKTRK
jgi:hypothetical protein